MHSRIHITMVDPTTRSGKVTLFLGNLQNFFVIAFAGGIILSMFGYAGLEAMGETNEVNKAFIIGVVVGIYLTLCFYATFVKKIFIQEIRNEEPVSPPKHPRRRRPPGSTETA